MDKAINSINSLVEELLTVDAEVARACGCGASTASLEGQRQEKLEQLRRMGGETALLLAKSRSTQRQSAELLKKARR